MCIDFSPAGGGFFTPDPPRLLDVKIYPAKILLVEEPAVPIAGLGFKFKFKRFGRNSELEISGLSFN